MSSSSTALKAGKAILVTGANRGIGLAICNAILKHECFNPEDRLYLGSRSFVRGLEAIEHGIDEKHAAQVKSLQLDVTDQISVEIAKETIESEMETDGLEFYGMVNNAGGYYGGDVKAALDINIYGMKRVTKAFLPLLTKKGGRVVNISSAAGPNYVNRQSDEDKAWMASKDVEWSQCEDYINKCLQTPVPEGGEWTASYGLSKAMVNCYTRVLARENPDLVVNSVTPGYILTDLTRSHAEKAGKTPEEMGMKSTDAGAKAPVHCLFADDIGHGWYYGSDCVRSPIDRYRSPGDPAFAGED